MRRILSLQFIHERERFVQIFAGILNKKIKISERTFFDAWTLGSPVHEFFRSLEIFRRINAYTFKCCNGRFNFVSVFHPAKLLQ